MATNKSVVYWKLSPEDGLITVIERPGQSRRKWVGVGSVQRLIDLRDHGSVRLEYLDALMQASTPLANRRTR